MPAHSSFGSACASGQIVTLVRRDGLRIPVHKELVKLIAMLMDLTEAMGYDIIPGWTWGQACRFIDGTTVWSFHAKGTAIDLNAPKNPYASAEWHRRNARGTFPFGLRVVCDIPEKVFRLWESHGFGDVGVKYRTKPDPMHLGFTGTVTDARAITARLAAFLNHPPTALPNPDVIVQGDRLMYRLITFRGEPTAPGDQPNVSAVYRCLLAYAEVSKKHLVVDAYHVPADKVQDWKDRGLKVDTVVRDIAKVNTVNFHGGPFDNTPTV